MQNRIIQHLSRPSKLPATSYRPQLTLKMDRPFPVDMENFFELSFSFAEALMDLEDKYESEPHVATLDRVLSKTVVGEASELDIDVRWM